MAPKPFSLSHQPSKEKEQRERQVSVEEDDEEEDSEAQYSRKEQENLSDETETEEGSSEDEEEDQENLENKKSPIPAPFDSKSISEENGSDSDTFSEGYPSDHKLQPIRKPSTPSSKRSFGGSDANHESSKSCKKLKSEEKKSSSTPGAGCITRLWSNEDEVAVLNGMIDFKSTKSLDPNADMGAFYNFIKGKLQVDFSRDQLRTKIIRMKKRFVNALKKGEKSSLPVFSKPHEELAFELSNKIWGGTVRNRARGKNVENAKKEIVKAEEEVAVDEKIAKIEKHGEERDFWAKYPFLNASFQKEVGNFPSLAMSAAGKSFLKENMSLIGNVKAKELDEKWKQLAVEETELNYKMLTLMREQVIMALNQ